MKFTTPAGRNPIDRLKVVGQPTPRIAGRLKTTGSATYAAEHRHPVQDAVHGYIVGAAIAKGRIAAIDISSASAAPGVLAVITADNAGQLGIGKFYRARALAGPEVEHYHQAVALVVAHTFEQARAAAALVRVDYVRSQGSYDLDQARRRPAVQQPANPARPLDTDSGDFEAAFASAPLKLDQQYTTPDHAHAMMEPHASIAAWNGKQLTLWNSIQLVGWGVRDLALTLGIERADIRIIASHVGGGFGGKGSVQADAVLAALAARRLGRPVKVSLQRHLMFNNTTHRPATIGRIRIGATPDGTITAIGHESWSGNLSALPEMATIPTRLLYAGAHRKTRLRMAHLDLPEGNAMRAPGETPGLMALEVAMDEMAEQLGLDPVAFRIHNDTQVDPESPGRAFSTRQLVQCMQTGGFSS